MFPKFEPTEIEEVETETLRRLKARRSGYYLFGPIRIADIHVASKLGGPCLALLLAVHHRQAYTAEEAVTLPTGFLAEFGIGKNAKQRGLKRLEEAKLINVKRAMGHTALVELCSKKIKARPKSLRKSAPRSLRSLRTAAGSPRPLTIVQAADPENRR